MIDTLNGKDVTFSLRPFFPTLSLAWAIFMQISSEWRIEEEEVNVLHIHNRKNDQPFCTYIRRRHFSMISLET